ncbi:MULTISPECIES: BlaI/MecI/CopY family transcriptional regulator [unclassified Luteimonas]|uniref:BlaI/MecI/CopY family transcriptional regulator n=1 Tax=unclassified Luteimonas TaxID=2629088 RepID=UPI0018F0FFE1|nr:MULTISPECIES: BlaI/MecI/CopY family transcriptional regulator [unclassified Luteimonas]MBJ6981447.1 BlaI/MecI/CopY family transcriptional regulator [Luteimonas sp. MC1572]MBJ7575986.1 BlaI/MecI/CopY family transcriptional regulator [Luteimonas sp. MC1828]QQO02756.1 BlaI/MecI/CopY family transcriptional regulator [Luteimonas sp. MC1572]
MSISDAEAVVMDVLWRRQPLAAEDVVAQLAASSEWAEPTIKTLLNRLLRKGAVRAERDGRRYLYSPVLTREAWVAQQSQGVVDRLFGGRVAPLVAHFSERGKLSPADIAELRRLIDGLDDDRR